jgi:hypothetical protein
MFDIKAQNKVNVSCMDFTFQGKKNSQGNSLKKIFEEELVNSSLIWNVVERDRMDLFFQKLQEEKNLYKDFNKVLKNPELAGVDYLIIGDIDLNITLDKYKVNISFIKLTGESITTKFPVQISFTRTDFLDEDSIKAYFRSAIKDFTESHFILNSTDWVKAPNFYNELDKRDSIIGVLKSENQIQKEELSKVKTEVTDLKDYSFNATLDIYGAPQKAGYGMIITSPLIECMHKIFVEKHDTLNVSDADSTLSVINRVIVSNPKFPFIYFAKALFSLNRGNLADYHQNAEKAISILKITTTIDGHKPEHDAVLARLVELNQRVKDYLKQQGKN